MDDKEKLSILRASLAEMETKLAPGHKRIAWIQEQNKRLEAQHWRTRYAIDKLETKILRAARTELVTPSLNSMS